MTTIFFILITLVTFSLMELVTWLTHKYVMHGFLWYLHEDHHNPVEDSVFEKNDAFFVIFAVPSILLFYFGIRPDLNALFFIGLGIFFYGLGYFLVHDVLIHQRFSWFKNTRLLYLRAIMKSHELHHIDEKKSYGMLYVPWKYVKMLKK